LGSFLGATTAGFLYGIDPGAPFLAALARFLVTAAALFLPTLTRLILARHALEAAAHTTPLAVCFRHIRITPGTMPGSHSS
jgi:hypothetical protein